MLTLWLVLVAIGVIGCAVRTRRLPEPHPYRAIR